MRKKFETNIDVVTAARQRIRNIFSNGIEVVLSVSGGKDSICLNDLVFKMAQSGEINKRLLRVSFVDEEAIFPCIEEIVQNMRKQWLMLGVPFDWYAMEFKHFNCLNQLTSDESFICFDETKRDVWVRNPPQFAIREHRLLNKGHDTYQDFFKKVCSGKIIMIGVRASESLQRMTYLAKASIEASGKAYPIYDWKDEDVWKYIFDNGLEFPNAYMYMYQCGIGLNRMRISQFFSVDTAGVLVKMCEYYPHLFDRVCRREQNAYMAMLYFDTELFRRKKGNNKEENIDYKGKVFHYVEHPEMFIGESGDRLYNQVKRIVVLYGQHFLEKDWKKMYNICVGGDPKQRSLRSIMTSAIKNRSNEAMK